MAAGKPISRSLMGCFVALLLMSTGNETTPSEQNLGIRRKGFGAMISTGSPSGVVVMSHSDES